LATSTVIGMSPTPVWRPTARILVVDPDGRVLLFSSADADGATWWFTPGGAVQRGETLTAAAVRELAEETGYACAETDLGPVVATCAGRWPAQHDGKVYFAADSFFFLRVPHATVDSDGQEDYERVVITGHRWWTVADMRRAVGTIFPVGLGDLIDGLLHGGAPERPVLLPWTLDFP
jgi:8-oxo-dGTP pyrophosphatase MutT (NUDIX family)